MKARTTDAIHLEVLETITTADPSIQMRDDITRENQIQLIEMAIQSARNTGDVRAMIAGIQVQNKILGFDRLPPPKDEKDYSPQSEAGQHLREKINQMINAQVRAVLKFKYPELEFNDVDLSKHGWPDL